MLEELFSLLENATIKFNKSGNEKVIIYSKKGYPYEITFTVSGDTYLEAFDKLLKQLNEL